MNSKIKLFEIYLLKEDVCKAIDRKCDIIPFYLQCVPNTECNHPVNYHYCYSTVDNKNAVLPSDSVHIKIGEQIAQIPTPMKLCGNFRNVLSSSQYYTIKTRVKQQTLGRPDGETALHRIIAHHKQQFFKENMQMLGIDPINNKLKWNSYQYAGQSIYSGVHPFHCIIADPFSISLLKMRGTNQTLYIDSSKKQMKYYKTNRYDGLIDKDKQLFRYLNEMWTTECCVDPCSRNGIGGGGTITIATMLHENGTFENLSLLFNCLNNKSLRMFEIPFKSLVKRFASDWCSPIIGPVCHLLGFNSIKEYVQFRWKEEYSFTESKRTPFYQTCHNHFMKNIVKSPFIIFDPYYNISM